mgnify:CR=1 FL=1
MGGINTSCRQIKIGPALLAPVFQGFGENLRCLIKRNSDRSASATAKASFEAAFSRGFSTAWSEQSGRWLEKENINKISD